jgi:hypothetical protein
MRCVRWNGAGGAFAGVVRFPAGGRLLRGLCLNHQHLFPISLIPISPPQPNTLQKETELWAEWFVQRTGIPAASCACIGVTGGGGSGSGAGPESAHLDGISTEIVPLDAPEALRKTFDRLVTRILKRKG